MEELVFNPNFIKRIFDLEKNSRGLKCGFKTKRMTILLEEDQAKNSGMGKYEEKSLVNKDWNVAKKGQSYNVFKAKKNASTQTQTPVKGGGENEVKGHSSSASNLYDHLRGGSNTMDVQATLGKRSMKEDFDLNFDYEISLLDFGGKKLKVENGERDSRVESRPGAVEVKLEDDASEVDGPVVDLTSAAIDLETLISVEGRGNLQGDKPGEKQAGCDNNSAISIGNDSERRSPTDSNVFNVNRDIKTKKKKGKPSIFKLFFYQSPEFLEPI